MTTSSNALQRTAALRSSCNRRAPWPPSLSLGRLAAVARLDMNTSLIALVIIAALLAGCVTSGPAVSKNTMGNLEVSVTAPQDMDTRAARIFVDAVFVGNVSDRLPVLHLKRGKHTVRVELEGTKSYEQSIAILGDPNHQVLNVALEKK